MGKNEKPSVKAELDKYRDDVKKEQRGAAPRRDYQGRANVRKLTPKKKSVKER